MLPTSRREALVHRLRFQGQASVEELASALDASTATIRRDLEALADSGVIERTWGGARVLSPDDAFAEAERDHADAKLTIARYAASLVPDGSTVILDIGTTVYALAPLLRDRRLTVITASCPVVHALADVPSIRLVVLGGDYSPEYQCTQGAGTINALSRVSAELAILGCSGVDGLGRVRDTSDQQAMIKRAVVESVTDCILLADHSKFPGRGADVAFSVSALSTIVTDQPLSDALTALCTDHHTEVHIP